MGGGGSKLRAAEATISRLQTELKATSAVVTKEAALSRELAAMRETQQVAARSEGLQEKERAEREKATSKRLEAALEAMKTNAEKEKEKRQLLEQELQRVGDELREKNNEKDTVIIEAEKEEEKRYPVFGKEIYDFGDKKVYAGDAGTVRSGTVTWAKQRAFREDRAEMIAKSKKSSKVPGWPGAITVVADEQHVTGTVVDGQHRLGAAYFMNKDPEAPTELAEILVEVYGNHASELFAEINKAEPVALLDLPEAREARSADRELVNAAAEDLQKQFPSMFKPTRACRTPHLNLDVLRDEVFKSGIATNDLNAFFKKQNDMLSKLEDARWLNPDLRARGTKPDIITKALDKAKTHNFYLGLTWVWLHNPDLKQ